jgi:hypothetical protein
MEKMFYSLSDNADLSNLYLQDLEIVKQFIEDEISGLSQEDLKEVEWRITPIFMTQDEFDNLPEYQF